MNIIKKITLLGVTLTSASALFACSSFCGINFAAFYLDC